MRLFIIILILALPLFGAGQESTPKPTEIVYLKDGSILKGEILQWKQNEFLVLLIKDNIEINIPAETIKKVIIKHPRSNRVMPRKEIPGFYGGAGIGLGFSSEDGLLAIDGVGGYRFHPMAHLGAGAGVYRFNFDDNEHIYPVYGEWRGDWSTKAFSPYTVLRVGTGFASWNNSDGFGGWEERRSYQPGFFINPMAGLRLGAVGQAALALEFGYVRYQGNYTTENTGWGGNTKSEIDFVYQRWVFRLAVGF